MQDKPLKAYDEESIFVPGETLACFSTFEE
jgi:hypothetical protein